MNRYTLPLPNGFSTPSKTESLTISDYDTVGKDGKPEQGGKLGAKLVERLIKRSPNLVSLFLDCNFLKICSKPLLASNAYPMQNLKNIEVRTI
jgi:hypothetical protein